MGPLPGNISSPDTRREALWALSYFILFLLSLFFTLENEFRHWITMVIIPAGLVFMLRNYRPGGCALKSLLESFGLERSRLARGVIWAIAIGVALSLLQLLLSRNSGEIMAVIRSGSIAYRFPSALALMLITAGSTEEFFFRGFLQTRLQRLFSSNVAAVIVTSLLFGVYHLPYAYLNPRWPSHGDLPTALTSAMGEGVPAGLILGTLYARTGNNLLAPVVVHSLLNALPAMLVIAW